MSDTILQVKDLKMHFPIRAGILLRQVGKVHAVDGISFETKKGQTLGLVGESGCGKSTIGRSIIRLYDPTDGQIIFDNKDITKLSKKELEPLRRNVQMIFQDPFESLNPRHTVGRILEEPLVIHNIGTKAQRQKTVRELLDKVGLASSAAHRYPHEFSGGQRQRIGIARAIALKPKLIICDEPVSALDVSVQSQILNLLIELQQEMQLSYLFIAHDLAVVKHVSDQIAVMYLGKMVEFADAETLYQNPKHPYTQALISAIPLPDPKAKQKRIILKGDVPSPINPPSGCSFHTRCPIAKDICRKETPKLEGQNGHLAACHFAN